MSNQMKTNDTQQILKKPINSNYAQKVSFSYNAPKLQQPIQQPSNSFFPKQISSSSSPPLQYQQNVQSAPQQIPSSNVSYSFNQQQQSYIPQQEYAIQQNLYSQPAFFAQQQQSYLSNSFQNQQIEQIPQIYQCQIPYQSNKIVDPFGHYQQTASLALLNKKQQDKDKEVVAVIVTISSGGSYDHLFTSVQQKSQQGTKVLVYQAPTSYIEKFIQAYKGNPADDEAKQMMEHINKLHPDCVVFNWECCGAYGQKHFLEGKEHLFEFLNIIIEKGHMAMFSDFSLKALINDWNSDKLGPNPFFESGQTSKPIDMKFNPGQLKQCPSAQLQIIGQMAETGTCHIDVMGGTIVYSVKKENLNHNSYKLKVLSVSTGTYLPGTQNNFASQVGQHIGTACHVLLTYPSGGMILTSMGHWIELMKVDTSEKKLFQVAEQNFGVAYAQQMKSEYASLDTNQQKAWVSKNAVSFVQNQAPCSNMSKKMMKY